MPSFDFKNIKVGQYDDSSGEVSYSEPISMGEAMDCTLTLKHAEGRLYAEGRLAEYLKEITGGTLSIGVKYIPTKAQIMMYGAKSTTRQLSGSKSVEGIKLTEESRSNYVGVSAYAPDMVDGVKKYSAIFVPKSLFGPPDYVYKTKGESLVFQTPTTTGEFLASKDKDFIEYAILDTEDEAIEWCDLVFKSE